MRCVKCEEFIFNKKNSRRLTLEEKVEGYLKHYTFCLRCFEDLKFMWNKQFNKFLNEC